MVMIKLPCLYTNDNFVKYVNPIRVSITQNIVPLSTASMQLLKGDELPARSYMELFTPYGSAGMFRIRSPHNAYGQDYTTVELEHMIAELGDYLVKDDISKMASAQSAIKSAFKHYGGSRWTLGSVSALGTDKIAFEANYDSVLSVFLSILEQKPDCYMKFDFTTKPWRINFANKGTTVAAEGRLSRNVKSAVVSYDDSQLATKVWYQVYETNKKTKKQEAVWKSKTANISKYGTVEAKISTSSDMTDEEITATVDAYLNAHKAPKVSVSIQATDLYNVTKESLDKFNIGDLFQLAIPEHDVTVKLNITSITWNDVYNTPEVAEIRLGEEQDTVVTFLHNLDSTGRGTRGGGGGRHKKKVEDETGGFTSQINQESERISLLVEGTGSNAKVKPAAIVMAINSKESTIKISADKINLDGYVTAKQLDTKMATINNLITGKQTSVIMFVGQITALTANIGTRLGGAAINGHIVNYYDVPDVNGNTVRALGYRGG